jgi:curved DNA-binding protein CbpA
MYTAANVSHANVSHANVPQDYYLLLGLSSTAQLPDIRQAYRELSKQYHPDTTTLSPEVAAVKFQQLQEAYATLTNPDRRYRYDLMRGCIPHGHRPRTATPGQPQPEEFVAAWPPDLGIDWGTGSGTKIPHGEGSPFQGSPGLRDGIEPGSVAYGDSAYLDPFDRALSAGEIFALFLLGLTFLGCIILAIALGIARGELILGDL